MKIRWNLSLVLATFAVVAGATLAIAGSSSGRLVRKPRAKVRGLASANYVKGLQSHRFRVTVQTLRKWLSGPTPPLLVDVRHRASYKVGHVPGAILRPASDLLLGKATLKAKGRQLVIYDQSGRLAPYLIHPLRSRGLDAYLLAGGFAAWMAPSASRQAARRAARGGAHGRRPASAPPMAPPPKDAAPPPVAAPPPMAPPPTSSGSSSDSPPADEGC